MPIRIPTEEFKASRTQRKVWNRNSDIEAAVVDPEPTDEKFDLFVRYQESRHEGTMCTRPQEFRDFLYASPLRTREVVCRLHGRLVACAIFDIEPLGISSVYSWFDPDEERRSLGSWMVMMLTGLARRARLPYHYLGYYVRDCAKMNYKTRFQPCEVWDGSGLWKRVGSGRPGTEATRGGGTERGPSSPEGAETE